MRKFSSYAQAVYHFCFYRYLFDFLQPEGSTVYPEFPTCNGKIDLLIRHQGWQYGLELKSFINEREYYAALKQAARYGKTLGLSTIWLLSFLEYVDEKIRQKYEVAYRDQDTKVNVIPIFVVTGR